jgi:hypothetical protein
LRNRLGLWWQRQVRTIDGPAASALEQTLPMQLDRGSAQVAASGQLLAALALRVLEPLSSDHAVLPLC